VVIARAVHFKRTLPVLDEPTSALAVWATEALFEYLRSLRAQGLSSVLVTHNLYDAGRKFPKLPARKISALASMLSVEDGIDVIRLGHQEQE
jgi:ABC-type polar amino acid transport system ATPase subunit